MEDSMLLYGGSLRAIQQTKQRKMYVTFYLFSSCPLFKLK